MGRISSSTPLTTASASARPTNTTNAYILFPPLRRTARRSPLFDSAYDPWLPKDVTFFGDRRSVLADGRRPGARQGVSAWRAWRSRLADPRDVRRRLRVVPADARRPGRGGRRDAGGLRASDAGGARLPRGVGVRDVAAPRHGQRLPHGAAQALQAAGHRHGGRRRALRPPRR